VNIEAKRTIERTDELVSRRMVCRACGGKFILVLE
jgi:hypothetical protein